MKLHRFLLLTFCAYALISCGGAEERKAVYMEKARLSVASGDFDKARIELKNVLQIDPKYAAAYYQLGKVHEELQQFRKAYGHYLKAEELNPDLLENQARLGRIYLLLANQPDKAQEKIDYILSKEPNNPDGLLLKATMMVKNKDVPGAIAISEKVNTSAPEHINAAIHLASLYTNEGEAEKAISVLESSIKLTPDNIKLNKLLAAVFLKNKNYDKAEVLYKRFLERNPDNKASYDNLAAFYNQSDNKPKAEETLRASVANDTGDVERQLTLVKYIVATEGKDAAITELEKLVNQNSGLGSLRTGLAELQFLNGDRQAAIDTSKKSIVDFSDEATGIDARIALAKIYLSDGEFEKASSSIDDALLVSPNDPKVNFLRAKLAIRDKDYEAAILSLRIVTKETPENTDAFLLLAGVYQAEGNEDQIRSTINSAYENNRTNAASLLKLAKYHVTRDINQAEKIIDDYNNIKENDYEGLSLKAAIYNKKKAQAEAHEVAKNLRDLYPDKPNGYLQAVPYYSVKKDIGKAISMLEKGYLNVEDNRTILILLTTFQASEKQFDIVINRIQAELKASPNDAELKMLLAKVYLADNKGDEGVELINEVIDTNPGVEEPYIILSQVHLMRKDNAAIKEILIKGKNNVGQSIKIPLKLASLYELDGNHLDAIATYREIHKNYPDNLLVINNLASMLSDYGNDEEDLAQAKTLIAKLEESNQPVFLDTIGWVYYKLGDNQKAVEFLSKVVKKAPEINVFNYHLGMAHKMAGDKVKAKVYLEKSLAGNKAFKQKNMAEAALKDL